MSFSLPFTLAIAATCGLASATVVNIDFNTSSATYTGLAGAPDAAGGATAHWNPLLDVAGSASSLALQDSTNTATGIGFSLTGITGSSGFIPREQELSGGYSNLMRDYVYVDSASSTTVATMSGQFTGLVVGGSYDLYLYGQGEYLAPDSGSGGYRGQNTLFSAGASSAQTSWDGVVGGNGLLVNGIEYVVLSVVAADGGALGGVISFDIENVVPGSNVVTDSAPSSSNGGARRGSLNAIQLVSVVPEPSSALLGMLGALGLMIRRR